MTELVGENGNDLGSSTPKVFGVDRQDWSPGLGYSFVAFCTCLCCANTQAMLTPLGVGVPCKSLGWGALTTPHPTHHVRATAASHATNPPNLPVPRPGSVASGLWRQA